MSRRDRQHAQRRIDQRQRQQAHEREVEHAPDWPTRARLTSSYQRETRGRVCIREPFYLCELGLNDVMRGMTVVPVRTPHADHVRVLPITHEGRR